MHDKLQQECFWYLWNNYPQSRRLSWHTENEMKPYPGESKRSFVIRLNQRKSKGVVKGVWDLVFYWKGCLHIFDVKVGADTVKGEQIKFRDCIIAQGGKSYVVRNFETFKNVVDGIFEKKCS